MIEPGGLDEVTRWELRSFVVSVYLKEATHEMNRFGEEGWELVQVCPPSSFHEGYEGKEMCLVWFKRKKSL